MCKQLVTIGSCKHHYFTGIFLKCEIAITIEEICDKAKEAKDLYNIFNVLLDEKDQAMCEPCQFLYDKAERKEPEPDDELKALELEGMKMRQAEYEKNKKKYEEIKAAEKEEKEKKAIREAVKNGQAVPQTRKQLANQIMDTAQPQTRRHRELKPIFAEVPQHKGNMRWHRKMSGDGARKRRFEDMSNL
jgi:hypothetical protein